MLTNGFRPTWDKQHGEWLTEYSIRVFDARIDAVQHEEGKIRSITFDKGQELLLDTLFTTRGDVKKLTIVLLTNSGRNWMIPARSL